MSHTGLCLLFSKDIRTELELEEWNHNFKKQIANEISSIQKSMNCLPTLKEADALPDLLNVLQFSETLLSRDNFFDLNLEADSASRNFIIDQLFSYVSYSVIKTKIYNDKKIIKTADSIFLNLVQWGTSHIREQNIFIMKMLNVIMNSSAEYYKTNGKDSLNNQPFGEPYPFFEEQEEWIKGLQKWEFVDYVRKTPDGRNIWIPAEIVDTFNNSGKLEVRYFCDTQVYFVYNVVGLRKYGEKKSDYEWREKLKVYD